MATENIQIQLSGEQQRAVGPMLQALWAGTPPEYKPKYEGELALSSKGVLTLGTLGDLDDLQRVTDAMAVLYPRHIAKGVEEAVERAVKAFVRRS